MEPPARRRTSATARTAVLPNVRPVVARGALGSVLVLLGGLVGAALPASTPLLRLDALVVLRDSEVGRMLGLTIVMVGLGILAAQWLRLCRTTASAEDTSGSDDVDALALVRRAAAWWSLPLLVAPPLFSRDGWSYAAQGALVHAGLSPYDHGPAALGGAVAAAVDPRWADTAAPYGPLPLVLGGLASAVTASPWLLVVWHRLLALVGLVLLAWALPRLARWAGASPSLACALALVSPLTLAAGVAGLHNDLLMVGLMAAALVVGVERHWALGAVVAGLAAAVKLPGGLVCVAIALAVLPAAAPLVVRLARLAATGGVAVATLVGLSLASGLGLGWLGALGVPVTVATPLSLTTVTGGLLDAGVGAVGLPLGDAALLELARLVGSVAVLVVVAAVALRAPTGDRGEALRRLVVVLVALVLLSPVVHLWYLLWVLPFAACLRLPRWGTASVLVLSLVLGLASPLDSSLHGAYLALTWGCLLIAVILPLLLATRTGRARVERIAQAHLLPT